MKMLWLLSLGFCLAGCIGTDLVEEVPSTEPRLDISPATAAVQQGDTLRFTATYYDAFGQHQPDVTLQWQSSDPSVATINQGGLVSAQKAGQVLISAHTIDADSPPAHLTIVTDPSVVARIEVTPTAIQLEPGATHTFTATAHNLRGETIEGLTFSWESTTPDVATISTDGVVTAHQPGTTNITAMTHGVTSAPARLVVPGRSRRGTFVKRPGTSYTLAGNVTLEEQPGGGLLLKLEDNFMTSQGPGVHVFLSNTNTVTSTSQDVGLLRQISGADTYTLPASVTIDSFDWVIIYCLPFNVVFGYAELQ